ncbi:MAG: hypothetical protein HY701_07420, partial [Gemmatimonadetes bacterium]|nr:hypothetical protein [Gemmatimonadota bacterium]
ELNDAKLEEGSFTTSLYRVAGSLPLSPWTAITGNVQYDAVSNVMGFFVRMRWTLTPGSDLYVVYTHNLEDLPGRFATMERQLATKLAYSLRF